MRTTTIHLLKKAQKEKYAIAAFNINNMEIAQAVFEAARKERAPIICQTSEGALKYAGMDMLVSIATLLARQSDIPAALHLDHGKNIETVKAAIAAGYSSVMYDGSSLPYEDNVMHTATVVQWAHKKSVAVEAELGALSGIEDFVNVAERDAAFTDPDQAADFVKKTKCDFLAVAIGTSHGAYKFKRSSRLDIARVRAIQKKVRVPLVLHGASSVPQALVKKIQRYGGRLQGACGVGNRDLKAAVASGIAKVNTDTDLRLAFTAGIRKVLHNNKDAFDPRAIITSGYEEMVSIARWKIRLLGSTHKA